MDSALRKLRIKFVLIIMVSVALILSAVFTTIVVINYNNSVGEVYGALDDAIAHDTFRVHLTPFGNLQSNTDDATEEAPRFEIGGRGPDRSLIPVAVYAVRSDGTMVLASSIESGAMAESLLNEAATQATTLPTGHGYINSLGVYYARENRDGALYIAFADEASASEWQPLARTLVVVGLGTLALFFVVSLIFSKWALRPVEKSWKQQQRFVADASHELKTPLTVMAADVAILKRHSDTSIASQSQWVESIEREIDSMRSLVSDMLLLARADLKEKNTLDAAENINLSKLVNAQLLQFEPLAYERALEFDSDVASGVSVIGDKEKLQCLVSVLLDNAFKYVDEGGRITVTLKVHDASAVLAVSNSGGFIPPDDLSHVFARFYRADKARTRTEEVSYGLGLSIASAISHLHGGTISVDSAEGIGTTFTATLPLKIV